VFKLLMKCMPKATWGVLWVTLQLLHSLNCLQLKFEVSMQNSMKASVRKAESGWLTSSNMSWTVDHCFPSHANIHQHAAWMNYQWNSHKFCLHSDIFAAHFKVMSQAGILLRLSAWNSCGNLLLTWSTDLC
jgi:hypothetical protein